MFLCMYICMYLYLYVRMDGCMDGWMDGRMPGNDGSIFVHSELDRAQVKDKVIYLRSEKGE